MARVVVLENPAQRKGCLAVDMAKYIAQIPARFGTFTALIDYLDSAPFVADDGFQPGAGNVCVPRQRSRVWPREFNCWEATAHVAAEGIRLLPSTWVILIQDQTFGNTRHVWPTISFMGKLAAPIGITRTPAANAWYNDLFGGVHWAGDKVLRFFGGGSLSDSIASASGDSLPDWARTEEQKKAHDNERLTTEATKPSTTTQATKPTQTATTAAKTDSPESSVIPDSGRGAMDDAI